MLDNVRLHQLRPRENPNLPNQMHQRHNYFHRRDIVWRAY